MTTEEKIAELINIRDNFNYTLAPREVFDDAIKAMEQEPILGKLRTEIMDTGAYEQEVNGKTEFLEGINYCLSIIDKYKEEMESEE